MSITLDEVVYEGYRAMAADQDREADAAAWCNGLAVDVADAYGYLDAIKVHLGLPR